ncbi:cytochrome P450 [Streptomyces sp. NPDC096132]|uniref:cytochrome P450 n=1 Tax=Streptomyces sp. NPDC096132 TaxID=3366075 RepID=UPI003829CA05
MQRTSDRTCPVVHLPVRREDGLAPPPDYAGMLALQPVFPATLHDGREVWAVARHSVVREVLNDVRFSTDRRREGYPLLSASQPARRRDVPRNIIPMDPPEHPEARRAVTQEFTLRRINQLRPRIQQVVDERIDRLLEATQPVDLFEVLALPVPSLVICELIGVPYRDHAFFEDRSSRFLSAAASREERAAAVEELRDYMHTLVADKERNPTEDLLGRQARDGAEHGYLVELGVLLLVAGHETTASMIGLGTLALLQRPHLWEVVRTEPDRVPDVVEELLRWFTIAERVTVRVAIEDVELYGRQIRAGDGVLLLTNAANHDPEAVAHPDVIDPDQASRQHLAFGFGPHLCLGANLARAELEIALATLTRRVPGLRLAVPVSELRFRHESSIFGPLEIPVHAGTAR